VRTLPGQEGGDGIPPEFLQTFGEEGKKARRGSRRLPGKPSKRKKDASRKLKVGRKKPWPDF